MKGRKIPEPRVFETRDGNPAIDWGDYQLYYWRNGILVKKKS
jgi:hypothetical protein